MVIRLDDPLLPNFTPPCHFGCRSLLSGVTIFEKLKPTNIKDLEVVPKTQFQEIEIKNKRKDDLKEINRLRDKKTSDLTLDELKKISSWEVNNARNILAVKEDFKPFIKEGSYFKQTISKTTANMKKSYSLLKSYTNSIKDLKKSYDNLKGPVREMQIAHKLILDKNTDIIFLGEKFGKLKQEVDIAFNKSNIYFIGEIKSGKINRDYFDDLNQGSNLIKTALDKDMTLVFFFDNNIDDFKIFLEKQAIFKNNPKLKYNLVDSKRFLADYDNF